MSCEILLEFYGAAPELTKVLFRRDSSHVLTCVRGKTAGASHEAGTFQWSSAVRALSTLFVKALQAKLNGSEALLSGSAGSLASTLDYALSKQPVWMMEMFGLDARGQSFLRRMVLRTNPERKYPGPVTITLNSHVIDPAHISIWWDGTKLTSMQALEGFLGLLEIDKVPSQTPPRDLSKGLQKLAA